MQLIQEKKRRVKFCHTQRGSHVTLLTGSIKKKRKCDFHMNTKESLLLWLNLAMSLFNPNLHSGFQPELGLKVTINQLNLTD